MEEKEEIFKIRCYGKSELAMMYFPNLERKTAVGKLKRWIDRCGPLSEELNGIKEPTKTIRFDFTPKEVGLIARYLGEPY